MLISDANETRVKQFKSTSLAILEVLRDVKGQRFQLSHMN